MLKYFKSSPCAKWDFRRHTETYYYYYVFIFVAGGRYLCVFNKLYNNNNVVFYFLMTTIIITMKYIVQSVTPPHRVATMIISNPIHLLQCVITVNNYCHNSCESRKKNLESISELISYSVFKRNSNE